MVSKTLITIRVTSVVNVGLSSSMLMIYNRSGTVTIAGFCHGCVPVLIEAVILVMLAAAVGCPALVTAVNFFMCGVSGPLMIRSAMSCWTSGVIVWVWLCIAFFAGLRVPSSFVLNHAAVIAFFAFWTTEVCFLATCFVP